MLEGCEILARPLKRPIGSPGRPPPPPIPFRCPACDGDISVTHSYQERSRARRITMACKGCNVEAFIDVVEGFLLRPGSAYEAGEMLLRNFQRQKEKVMSLYLAPIGKLSVYIVGQHRQDISGASAIIRLPILKRFLEPFSATVIQKLAKKARAEGLVLALTTMDDPGKITGADLPQALMHEANYIAAIDAYDHTKVIKSLP